MLPRAINTFLLLATLSISLVVFDFAVGWIFPDITYRELKLNTRELTYEPNQTKTFKTSEWNYEVRINNDGFRDDAVYSEAPPGSVLFLGDSFIEGFGVPFEHTVGQYLQNAFAESNLNRIAYNAGHSGTQPQIYINTYRKHLSDNANISTVVLGMFLGNDFLAENADTTIKPAERGSTLYRAKVFLAEHSNLYVLLNKAVKGSGLLLGLCQKIGLCGVHAAKPYAIYYPEKVEPLVAVTARVFAEFDRELRNQGKRLLVLLIPPREQIIEKYWENMIQAISEIEASNRFFANQAIHEALDEHNVEVLDITDILLRNASNDERPLYYTHDPHWTSLAHKIAAEAVFERLTGN